MVMHLIDKSCKFLSRDVGLGLIYGHILIVVLE